jgi:hypothetical protein
MSTGLLAGLGGLPTGPLENSQTGRAAGRFTNSRAGFHPLVLVLRAAQHRGVERFGRAGLVGRNHRDLKAPPNGTPPTARAIFLAAPYLLAGRTSTFIRRSHRN